MKNDFRAQNLKPYLKRQRAVLSAILYRSARTWNEDDEHALRVAIHRLKICFQFEKSEFDKKSRHQIKKLRAQLTRLSQDVGEVRYWRVIDALAKEAHLHQANVKDKKRKAQKAVKKIWTRRARRHLLNQVEKALPGLMNLKKKSAESVLRKTVSQLNKARLRWAAHQPVGMPEWHELRLFTKQWRYSLEALQPRENGQCTQIKELTKFQDTLGELHDLQICQRELASEVLAKKLKKFKRKAQLQYREIFLP